VKLKTVIIVAVLVFLAVKVLGTRHEATQLQHNLNTNPATTGLHVVGGGK
jgi:hypothetical protein